MNDRVQGGSDDFSQSSTIELMQNRRDLDDDNKSLGEPLNETDKKGLGLRVSVKFYL